MAQRARDLGVNAPTFHPWSGKYHRVERAEKEVQNEHRDEERKRLRQANARLQADRDIFQKAAASLAPQRP